MPDRWFAVSAFAAFVAFYLLLAGSLTWTEGATAVGVACVTAWFMVIQRMRQKCRLALAPPPARVLLRALIHLVTDTVRVGAALLATIAGARHGEAIWQAFRPGGCSPHDAGRRALVTLTISLAPNGFVLDMRPSGLPEAERGTLLHRLAPAQPLSDADWPA